MRIDDIVDLGNKLERIRHSAFDLWTWLPSYRAAEKFHGDYASEFQPPIDEIMHEACEMFSHLRDKKFELPPYEGCPCGEDHKDEDTDKVNLRKELMANRNPCFLCQNAKGHHIQNLANFEYLLCMKSVNIDTCTYIGSCQDFIRVSLDDEVKRLEWADEFSAKCNNS